MSVMEILKTQVSNILPERHGVREGATDSYAYVPSATSLGCVIEDEVVQDLDSYCQDISDRLAISRIVDDTVMKGILKALFEEAAGMVAAKELQVSQLNEELQLQCLAYEELNARNEVACEQQLEQEIQKEIELVITRNGFHGIREGRGMRQLDQNAEDVHWIEKFREISLLHQELEAIHKTLSGLEFQHSVSQGTEEMDHLLRKVSVPSLLWEGSSPLEESKLDVPDKFEPTLLEHMAGEDLYLHYRAEMTKMKRDYESAIQRITEDNFSLKRELLKERELKERGSCLPSKRDKEFDLLKKKFQEIVLKLERILHPNENLLESYDSYGNKLDCILSEDRYMKDLLNDKEREIKHLSLKFYDDVEEFPHHSYVEKNLHGLVGDLQDHIEDLHIEASIHKEIFWLILKDFVPNYHGDDGEEVVKYAIMQEMLGLIYQEAVDKAEGNVVHDCIDISDAETIIEQVLLGVVCQEVLKDTVIELKNVKARFLQADECFHSLEFKALEMEKMLQTVDQENKKLKHEILGLEIFANEKDETVLDLAAKLKKEKKLLELENAEVMKLQNIKAEKEALILERNKELQTLKTMLEMLSGEIRVYKEQVNNLKQKLDQETTRCFAISEEKQSILTLVEAKDKEQRKQAQSLVRQINDLLKAFDNFELHVTGAINRNSLRLEGSTRQGNSLIKKANLLQRTELLYKERLEKRCGDLQKAEAEVDLLGDEVDALLGLLQKIYIGLDHYSPILQHYPGIMDVLRLVKIELSGESVKTMCRTE